ncbi:MAG TPA: translation initiation factor IF-2 [Candidatus Paceibacterota bacterium]
MKEKTEKTQRPPVVAVMGHIDHGKSTLLDYIRKTNLTAGEAGGITQHLSAYEAEVEISDGNKKDKRKITFLDTPGHEAFCSIRERGAKVADIALLVVSAEDGVKPQTLEALKCIKCDETPFIIAINKIDRPGANIEKVKQGLAENEVLVEGWGGHVPTVAISAKTGENISELLEVISLQADVEEFQGNKNIPAEGFVIESGLNPKQGIAATLIIKDGTLKIGGFVATEDSYAPVRAMENFKGENIKEATFSAPVRITGWNETPKAGEKFRTFERKEEAIAFSQVNKDNKNSIPNGEKDDRHLIMVIVKADTSGSLEALEHELKKLSNEKISLKIVSKGIGSITESDIKTANIKKSAIIGFNVSVPKNVELLALREKILIKTFSVIYELVDFVKEKIKSETPVTHVETVAGSAKVLRVFSKNRDRQVIGGRMTEGEIKSGNNVKILRRENVIGEGKVKEVQTQKIKASSVKEGDEFGMMVDSKMEIVEGDVVRSMEMVRQE